MREPDRAIGADELRLLGQAMYGNPDRYRLFGLGIDSLMARQIRLLRRTAIECCIDEHAIQIALRVRELSHQLRLPGPVLVVDPFAGSSNLLYWVSRVLEADGIGFESNPYVHAATLANLQRLKIPLQLKNCSYSTVPSVLPEADQRSFVYLFDPPWGKAFDPAKGLDMNRTEPPIVSLLTLASRWVQGRPGMAAVKGCERMSGTVPSELQQEARLLEFKVMEPGVIGLRPACLVFRLGETS